MNRFLTFMIFFGVLSTSNADILSQPFLLFSKAYSEIAPLFERAKIQTTWGGFYLRADNQYAFNKSDSIPSSDGFRLGVRTLPLETLKSAYLNRDKELQKIIILRFPNIDDKNGIVISEKYGKNCNKETIKILDDTINILSKQAQQYAAANP